MTSPRKNPEPSNRLPASTLTFHFLADLFPLLESAEFDALVADIGAHGVREAVVMLDGKILDGPNRWRAAQAAGVACEIREYEHDDPAFGDDPLAFVISLNLKRRHLNESQRAMIAAKLATLRRGDNQHSLIGETSQATAAKLLNVSKRSVERGAMVRATAVPELLEAVEQGRVAVSVAADLATISIPQQRDIMAGLPHDTDGKLTPDVKKVLAPVIREIRDEKAATKTARRTKAECQSEQFERAIHFLRTTCVNAVDIPIPDITAAQRSDTIKSLAMAKNAIAKLEQRFKDKERDRISPLDAADDLEIPGCLRRRLQ